VANGGKREVKTTTTTPKHRMASHNFGLKFLV